MNAAQLRSLPVQAGLIAGLFIGSLGLGGIIVSQRWRFESFVKESYAAPSKGQSESMRNAINELSLGKVARETWDKVPDVERRAVYNALMLREDLGAPKVVAGCLETAAEFFLKCAERTVVCGDAEQRLRGLKFLELSGVDQAGQALDRLAVWADRWNRPNDFAAIDETRMRWRQESRR